ncbi:hypothetical protein [Halomicrococcus gelatinilyticus]|uniref:hypothetical protein n=1 Tax=Halomicrococcus gelatinilyticus TaxID=1702103 RepID=UPI002E11675D
MKSYVIPGITKREYTSLNVEGFRTVQDVGEAESWQEIADALPEGARERERSELVYRRGQDLHEILQEAEREVEEFDESGAMKERVKIERVGVRLLDEGWEEAACYLFGKAEATDGTD